ncbi:leishmanolysin-related zinc metalloendopeptidase [Deinococcus budaensis]|uniref:BIG2 domain-containing protein n=1 Tax=Deinococcus budaensis TaxID=1665626 RepID=A0A7W8GH41_9DEIO|nr:hypothetical protein [Deinococcus budaensis]
MQLGTETLTLAPGDSQQVKARVEGSGDRGLVWASTQPGVARVDEVGRVTAVAPGLARITATSRQDPARQAQLTVTVSAAAAPPTADPFDITLVYPAGSPLTAAQRTAFNQAAQRWSQVITAGLPEVRGVRLSSGETVTVDDLVIVVNSVALDGPGGVLGQAGPRQVRPGGTLPLWGDMQFDAADLASLEQGGRLQGVVLHEMGHVLGIGTLWNRFLSSDTSSCASATRVQYGGGKALHEYRQLGGPLAGVPVEDQHSPGTKCGHWKEDVFQTELMTGFASAGHMPLSRLTLGALADLGYRVNFALADAYSLPAGQNPAPQSAGWELRERLITPDGLFDPAF